MKIAILIIAVPILLFACALIFLVLHPPKEWKGDNLSKMSPDEQRKHQESMYKLHQMG